MWTRISLCLVLATSACGNDDDDADTTTSNGSVGPTTAGDASGAGSTASEDGSTSAGSASGTSASATTMGSGGPSVCCPDDPPCTVDFDPTEDCSGSGVASCCQADAARFCCGCETMGVWTEQTCP